MSFGDPRFPLTVVSKDLCFWSLVESDDGTGLRSVHIAAALQNFFGPVWLWILVPRDHVLKCCIKSLK